MLGRKRGNMKDLIKGAKETILKAYAPYSNYKVAASVRDEQGRIYTGCNIENASYGATMCAERVAIFKAVSEGAKSIEEILILAEGSMPYPCGMCRQVMSEFMKKDGKIYVCFNDSIEEYTLEQLLPKSFEM